MDNTQNTEKFAFYGASQKERMPKRLLPDNIPVDEREIYEWLSFLTHAAEIIAYYDDQNQASDVWANILRKDPSVFVAGMLDNKPNRWDNDFRQLIRLFYVTPGHEQPQIVLAMIQKTLEAFRLIDRWYIKSLDHLKWGSLNPAGTSLEKFVKQDLQLPIRRFHHLINHLHAEKILILPDEYLNFHTSLHPDWTMPFPALQELEEAHPADKQFLHHEVEVLRQVFQSLHFLMVYVDQKAPDWFHDLLFNKQDHDPHMGLMLGFLQLLTHVRDQMNDFTRRHLHHYYFDILKQNTRSHQPDSCFVSFQLADHIDHFPLPAGTLLAAGVNDEGLASYYATRQNLVLTKTRIASLMTLYIGKSELVQTGSSYRLVTGIYMAPVANSSDGQGKPFAFGESGWPAFGEEQLDQLPVDRRMQEAELGFIVTSPVLLLLQGERMIEFRFKCTDHSIATLVDLIDDIVHNSNNQKTREELSSKLFSRGFIISATAQDKWFSISNWEIDGPDAWLQHGEIRFFVRLSTDDPALEALVLPETDSALNTPWPMVKFIIRPDNEIFLYSFLQGLELETLNIRVSVSGLSNLSMSNEIGKLPSSGSFMPFGPIPRRHAAWQIGNVELFNKRLTELVIRIYWNNLPELEGGFDTYYEAYKNGIQNKDFQVSISALSNGIFKPTEADQRQTFPLFEMNGETRRLKDATIIDGINLQKCQFKPAWHLRAPNDYSNETRTGYFNLQLSCPSFAFGHSEYPAAFGEAMIAQSKISGRSNKKATESSPESALPREPFTPIVQRIMADYTAETAINLFPDQIDENDPDANEKIMQVTPFGLRNIFSAGRVFEKFLFPKFDNDGYLFIGLEHVLKGQAVNIYCKVRPGRQRSNTSELHVQWQYLRADVWQYLPEDNLLTDNTLDFTSSGMISILIPDDHTTDNTILPAGLCWLRVSARGNIKVAAHIIGLYTNAVGASWIDNGDEKHFDAGVLRPPITELAEPRAEISNVAQITDFTGGAPHEPLNSFYTRVSERLRHKNRAITNWDIERMALLQFPELRRVKCINRLEYPQADMPPGDLWVVVIPQTGPEISEPALGFHELQTIADYIQQKASPWISLKVMNPVYEKIKISCVIKLKQVYRNEKGKYLRLLDDALRLFICPWLNGDAIRLGGGIAKNDVLSFIKNQAYVQAVGRFSMVLIYETKHEKLQMKDTARTIAEQDILYASAPWCILTPVDKHNIQIVEDDRFGLPEPTAIDSMRLGTDFIVLEGDEKDASGGLESSDKMLPDFNMYNHDDTDEWYLFPNPA